jgi:hypothetical protein
LTRHCLRLRHHVFHIFFRSCPIHVLSSPFSPLLPALRPLKPSYHFDPRLAFLRGPLIWLPRSPSISVPPFTFPHLSPFRYIYFLSLPILLYLSNHLCLFAPTSIFHFHPNLSLPYSHAVHVNSFLSMSKTTLHCSIQYYATSRAAPSSSLYMWSLHCDVNLW